MNNNIKDDLIEAANVLEKFIADEKNIAAIEAAGKIMSRAIKNEGKIVACGNGGSMCDAMHFAEELTGFFRERRKAIPALAVSDSSFISCTANDLGYEFVFSRYVEAMGKPGDILLAISTSGNSENVIKAAAVAKDAGMLVVGLTGMDGGRLAPLCDVEIRSPESIYSDRIQEIHIKVIHSLIHFIEQNI